MFLLVLLLETCGLPFHCRFSSQKHEIHEQLQSTKAALEYELEAMRYNFPPWLSFIGEGGGEGGGFSIEDKMGVGGSLYIIYKRIKSECLAPINPLLQTDRLPGLDWQLI